MSEPNTEPNQVPIHPSDAELTVTTADDWLNDSDDEEALKLKQQLDAKLIAADAKQTEQNEHRYYRGRGRGRGRSRGRSRGRGRGRTYRTSPRGGYRGYNRGNYRDRNRGNYRGYNRGHNRGYKHTYNQSNNRGRDRGYNDRNNYNKYDQYGNKIYSTKTNRGRQRIYRRTGGKETTKNDYFVQKRRQYNAKRKMMDSNISSFIPHKYDDNKGNDNRKQYRHGYDDGYDHGHDHRPDHGQDHRPDHGHDHEHMHKKNKYVQEPNKYVQKQNKYVDEQNNNQNKRYDEYVEKTPEAPRNLRLKNMSHVSYLRKGAELNEDVIMELVNEAIGNHQRLYRGLIDRIERLIYASYEDICYEIGDLVVIEYQDNLDELRQRINNNKFGEVVYFAAKELYNAHKQQTKQGVTEHDSAYVTYCMPKDDAFIISCCTLGMKLKNEGCTKDRVLMLPYECFDNNGNLLSDYNVFLLCFDICIPMNHSDAFPYYYFKLHSFALTQYNKILFIEPYCIINDDNLEIYYDEFNNDLLPCGPGNNNYGQYYQVMCIKPNQQMFDKLYKTCYNNKEQLKPNDINGIIASKYEWNTIENETDKDAWFYNVESANVEKDEAQESFVIAYFVDANPWEIYQELGKEKACKCTAIRVWMETAWKLVKDVPAISTLVNPEILKIIDPQFENKINANNMNDDNKENDNNNEEDSSDSNKPSPPPQYYDSKPIQENNDDNNDNNDKKNNDDLSDSEHTDSEQDNALKPRDIDDDDD